MHFKRLSIFLAEIYRRKVNIGKLGIGMWIETSYVIINLLYHMLNLFNTDIKFAVNG